mgnify:CR=1 FL=1
MEMVPLMSRTEAKDSVITLDYVSMYDIIKLGEVNCFSNQNIISHGLHILHLIFFCGLYIRAVSITLEIV